MPIETGPSKKKKYPISQGTGEAWPELEREAAHMAIVEKPQLMQDVNKIRPMNWYEKYALKGADAVTWPWGTVALNRDIIEQNKSNLGDVLIHELTHVGQKPGLFKSMRNLLPGGPEYLARPEEQEAFQAEAERKRRGDIRLPKGIDTSPSNRK